MRVAIVNASSCVTAAEAQMIARACDYQLREHFAPAWGIVPPSCAYYASEADVPLDAALVVILDDAPLAGILGYHAQTPAGRTYGRVFARSILKGGGRVLVGARSVSTMAAHEAMEAVGNPWVNLWVEGPASPLGSLYAREVCDAVEADSYPVIVDGIAITVSNFVLPAFFDTTTPPGERVDFLGRAPGPFQLAPGGFQIVRHSPGERAQLLATLAASPSWRTPGDHPASRTARLLG